MTRVKENITPRNSKGQRHGYWERYFSSGQPQYKCIYHNGKEIGYEEFYHYNDCNKQLTKNYYL